METTLNIDSDILTTITRAAKSKGISRSSMIIFLIKKTMADVPDALPLGKMVRYQKKRESGKWRIVHVSVSEYEYEYMVDLRKLLKMSVSLICAYAMEKYLEKPMRKQMTDNCPFFMNYIVFKEIIDNIISWRIIWGFTPDLKKFRRL